ncbi:MAG: hypothetical protein ACSLE1_15670 [Sphingobium sp.]
MSQYTDPNLTQRELVETSLAVVESLIASIDAAYADTIEAQAGPLDFFTAGKLGTHAMSVLNIKPALEEERIRLQNILNTWDGEPLIETAAYTYTPTLFPPVGNTPPSA